MRPGKKGRNKMTFKQGLCLIGVAFVVVFAVSMVYNLFKTNKAVDVDDETIAANRQSVINMQAASVNEVEAAVDALDAEANDGTISAGRRARYMRKFKDCMVIGDSLTEGLTVYQWLSSTQVISSIGGSIVYGEDEFTKVANNSLEVAFFAYGMNDMGNYSGDADAFIERYKELLGIVRTKSPDTEIYVCSISTPTADAIKKNSSFGHYKEFNEAIEKMCEDEGYTFIDISNILVENPDLYAGDGIHANTNYYPVWMDMMIEAANL